MLNIVTHKTILLQILKEIYTDTTLGPVLGFKGGAAAHLFYNLGRFSVDLNFDLLDTEKESYVLKRLGEISRRFGRVTDQARKKYTLLVELSYRTGAARIKIEVSRRKTNACYELKNYLGISMMVMAKEDMSASKLVAVLGRRRTAARDFFDVWFFLKNNWPINADYLKKETGLTVTAYLKKCVAALVKFPENRLLSGVGELLDEKTKIWAKKNLKKDLLFLLKARIAGED